mgnify:CR=1 FL=1
MFQACVYLEPTSTEQQGKISCSMKQREPLMGFELTTIEPKLYKLVDL